MIKSCPNLTLSRTVCLPAGVAVLLALLISSPAGQGNAQQRQVPASDAQVRLSYAPVVKRTAPAVVNVYVRRKVQQRNSPFLRDPFFRQFFGDEFGRPRQRVQNSLGSGVVVGPEGIIVTNYHVIKGRGKAEIKVALADKREFPASVILKDERTDLAVLKLHAPGVTFPYLDFDDSETLQVGDIVLAIGNPFGVGQTVTSGIVSALARTRVGISDYQFFIQTDAAINPGNSGGALVNMGGKLVGVNTAIYSRTGGSLGIGFAIPSNMVRQVVQSALRGNRVKRPWFGARLQRISPEIAESLGLDRPAGALVKQIRKISPAAKAGLRVGDVIVQVNGKPVVDPQSFGYRFSTKPIGGSVPLKVIRGGRPFTVSVPLRTAPEVPPRNETDIAGDNPIAGARIANLSPALAEELSLDEYAFGVVVMGVKNDTPANWFGGRRFGGLQRGDIILEVSDQRVRSVKQLVSIVRRRYSLWRITVRRKGRNIELALRG
ncbi:MAG TPA: DegQ family serine endoprotease [Rhizobiales bacterium]|nr:periplasmic serine endoprotease DegP precursor [bacterium BMS3Bbin10]HDO52003.1 DegQ family serine endoprotease [Hyphomicrobiales bacterium]